MSSKKIAVIGLGYVGLPLGVLLAKKHSVLGFDIAKERIEQLEESLDITNEVSKESLVSSSIKFSSNPADLKNFDIKIVTVPTPIDEHKNPDLSPLISASKIVGENLKRGDIVVYESTVYPGVTEETCVPVLEKVSGLKWRTDFFVGYSPERVNPGDKDRTIDKIVKVIAADCEDTLRILQETYGAVISAGLHIAPNIKTAEAAKVIENTQRDLNIALMNELSLIFNKMGISTLDVIDAAASKWNFLKFFPGLVGGHCIGVDPYYLTFKAKSLGYQPEVILSGRRINDSMGRYVASAFIKRLVQTGKYLKGKVLIAGFTFKENVPDIRNTRVIDIYTELKDYGLTVEVYDPHVSNEKMQAEYGISVLENIEDSAEYLGVLICVPHREFAIQLPLEKCLKIQTGKPVLFDLKGIFRKDIVGLTEFEYMSL